MDVSVALHRGPSLEIRSLRDWSIENPPKLAQRGSIASSPPRESLPPPPTSLVANS